MEHPTLFVALLLGIVEGLTEFLPISSTGHLIVAGSLLGYTGEQAKVFEIVIQAGAILAVCWEFRRRLKAVACGVFRNPLANRFVVNLAVAFVPAAALGLAFGRLVKSHLFAPVPVAVASVIGVLVILWAERRRGAEAMMPLSLFGSRAFLGLTIFTSLLYGALAGLMLLLPYTLIEAAGYSPIQAGLAVTPFPILVAATAPKLGKGRGKCRWDYIPQARPNE